MGVIEAVKALNPSLEAEFLAIKTTGDDPSLDLAAAGGPKGLFVKEIEAALVSGRINLAVHSAKDIPTELPPSLVLGPSPKRAPAGDLLCCAKGCGFMALPKGAKVLTSSVRRKAFLLYRRPDLLIEPVRGNVATRIRKTLDQGAATVIAEAAKSRLPDLDLKDASSISLDLLPPAPGQGALALEYREEDKFVKNLIEPLGDMPTTLSLAAERAFARRLNAGCQAPAAAYAAIDGAKLSMLVALAHPDGESVVSISLSGPAASLRASESLGLLAADKLLARAELEAPGILAALKAGLAAPSIPFNEDDLKAGPLFRGPGDKGSQPSDNGQGGQKGKASQSESKSGPAPPLRKGS
jgi:hydroxymethylbilane synthase